MSGVVQAGIGIGLLYLALHLWQRDARRRSARLWAVGVVSTALGIDALGQLHQQLVDTPGGGPAAEVVAALAVAVSHAAYLRWRELGSGLSERTSRPAQQRD